MTRSISSSRQASKRSRSSNASLDSRIGAEGGRSPLLTNIEIAPRAPLSTSRRYGSKSTDVPCKFWRQSVREASAGDPRSRRIPRLLASLHALPVNPEFTGRKGRRLTTDLLQREKVGFVPDSYLPSALS